MTAFRRSSGTPKARCIRFAAAPGWFPLHLLRASVFLVFMGCTPGFAAALLPVPPPLPSPAPPTPKPTLELPEDPRPFVNAPDGAGIVIEGLDGPLRPFSTVTITFPTDMVAPDRIGADGSVSPVVLWPPADGEFCWTTPSEGQLTITGPLVPDQTYRLRLREGLQDVTGTPLDVDRWGAEWTTPALAVTSVDYGKRSRLNSRPQVPIEFNYPIHLADAAEGIWFQDRSTRARIPAEVLLNLPEGEIEGATAEARLDEDELYYGIRVRPRTPLPAGLPVDLVVEGVTDAHAGRGLPYPRVFPLGTTRPLEVEYVGAWNNPPEPPRIVVKFSDLLDGTPLSDSALTITPAVPGLRLLKEGECITAEGKFSVGTRYTVTIPETIRGVTGYGLAKPETWGTTFKPPSPAVLFPARQIRERSALGFRFAFHQVATGPLEWKLAPVPLDHLAAVNARLREFERMITDDQGDRVWTEDGRIQRAPTEPLIAALGLTPVATGTVPGTSDNAAVLREISWSPASGSLSGPMVIEVTGRDARNRLVGNRALVFFGEYAITPKTSFTETHLRVASLGTGQPAPNATVSVLDGNLEPLVSGKTDAQGIAIFPQVRVAGAEYFSVDVGGSLTLQPVVLSAEFPSGSQYTRPIPPLRSAIFTDRPLYRPGQTIFFKGMVREERDGVLAIPAGRTVTWMIHREFGDQVAAGVTVVGTEGGWSAQWTPPDDVPPGGFAIRAVVDSVPADRLALFRIEEFRNPAWSVVCEPQKTDTPGEAVLRVSSTYFHGAPNVAAKVAWTAEWSSDFDGEYYDYPDGDDFLRVDLFSENAHEPSSIAEATGEAVLDGSGAVLIRCKPPFEDPGNRARCRVNWRVDITGPDGQSITGGAWQEVLMMPVRLGVRALESAQPGELVFAWDAMGFAPAPSDARPEPSPGVVDAELFHVATKTTKERVAPNVYRYHNSDQFTSVEKRTAIPAGPLVFTPGKPGRYVLVLTPADASVAMPVSESAFLSGEGPSENPITADTAATVLSFNDSPSAKEKVWLVGQTARLIVLAPSPGVAWVSVETDHVLDTFTVPLQGNTATIEIPVKPEYEPNAFVSVYLLRPGGPEGLAGEMFGYTPITVAAPGRRLTIEPSVDRGEYEPQQTVSGMVRVTAAGEPVPGADLALAVVDDSILTLGGWSLPSFLQDFYPARGFGVITWSALSGYVDRMSPSWLTSKGFVVGDGSDVFGNVTFVRKDFQPLLLWLPNVTTDASGIAKFSCKTPDSLTQFRVIAIGQTKHNQFGAGDTTFAVSKRLLIEPALPRFVRAGDEFSLRAVLRQRVSDTERLRVRCVTMGALELLTEPVVEGVAGRDAPMVVQFRARARQTGNATVEFAAVAASDATLSDAVQIRLPVTEPVLPRKESVAGKLAGSAFRAADAAPAAWKGAEGTFSVMVSTTPWLTRLLGIPVLIEYPHGCFEQQTSRLLAITHMGGLVDSLPEPGTRKENFARAVRSTFNAIEASLLPGALVPYWPQGTTPSDYVTIQAAWCVAAAQAAGFPVPKHLSEALPAALQKMASGPVRAGFPASLRAFALFVSTLFEPMDKEALVVAANELYLRRDTLTSEGRALLAIALHNLETGPDDQHRLLAELPETFDAISFNPETFASATRTETLCLWARILIAEDATSTAARARLEELMEASPNLSTQENLWLLAAFDALLKSSQVPHLRKPPTPHPDMFSPNRTAAGWVNRDLSELTTFGVRGLPASQGSFVLTASYRPGETATAPECRGMRIERVVKNLTDPSRTGSADSPHRIGDQLLIAYRFSSDKPHAFVVLEDPLPAGLEVVNPQLALFGKFHTLPDSNLPEAELSHSELRDRQTNLYFDRLPSGSSSYAVLARATTAGTFLWPAAQLQPMYDARFRARSASDSCMVAE